MSDCSIIELKNVCITYKTRQAFFRHKLFTALENISFKVKKGETLGIIGLNGCGKSTLLKVLAGIYQPDKGEINKTCKSTTLLSLGLGFDYELSGKDNALISAMLLGTPKKEALEKLPDIINFSELNDFILQPVKTYSAGMKARLGFSVAMSLNVELLLIDEVLSVGDIQFREKAEETMLNKIDSEQTVVFVSHNVGQIKKLCQRSLWLEKGKIKMYEETDQVLKNYNLAKRRLIND